MGGPSNDLFREKLASYRISSKERAGRLFKCRHSRGGGGGGLNTTSKEQSHSSLKLIYWRL